MGNFYRYEMGWGRSMPQDFTRISITRDINLGSYCGPDLFFKKGFFKRKLLSRVFLRENIKITDSIKIEYVNGQLLADNKEDEYVYFWVSGKRGRGHNSHKNLVIPPSAIIVAGGGEEAHTDGCCNKFTHVIFKIPSESKEVWIGDLYYGEYSFAIRFFKKSDGEWRAEHMLYDKFCAFNQDWNGDWDMKYSLPLPSRIR